MNHLTFPVNKKPKQYAQELLSTFALAIGEVALQPSSGGTFIVTIHHSVPGPVRAPGLPPPPPAATSAVLWDRKVDGGFPETKELKRRVRDVIEPGRNLGHVDRDHGKPQGKVEGGVGGGGGGSGNSQMDWQQRVAQGTDGNASIRAEGAAETKPPCDDCR
jgi:predicted Rdx family selenoprotein